MSRKIPVVALLLGALALACNEGTGPAFESDAIQTAAVPDGAINHLRWADADSPRQFTAVGGTRDSEILLSTVGGGSWELTTYQVSFWAVKGEDRSVQINYITKTEAGYLVMPYLLFEVPAGALDEGPNEEEYETGDSVKITITVAPQTMVAHYSPSGLQFDDNDPAVLTKWYTGADDDFNDDGVVDATDAYIEANLLGIYTQQYVGGSWSRLSAQHSMTERWFKANIRHFSGYAVSWHE